LPLDRQRLLVCPDAEIVAQERAEPEIVVAVEVGDRDPRFAQAAQCGEGSKVAARDRGAILEPEVEQVADDEDLGGASTSECGNREGTPGPPCSLGPVPRWASAKK
jgi:hypothetical protein